MPRLLLLVPLLAVSACNESSPHYSTAGYDSGGTPPSDTSVDVPPDVALDATPTDTSPDSEPDVPPPRDVPPTPDVAPDVPPDLGPVPDVPPEDRPTAVVSCWLDGSNLRSSRLSVPAGSTFVCSAEGSTLFVDAIWRFREVPESDNPPNFNPERGAVTYVRTERPGTYEVELVTVSDRGVVSDPAYATIEARGFSDLEVHVVWDTPGNPNDGDPDDVGPGTDLDLHLLHPDGCWGDERYDCHFRSREPNWGDPTSRADDPSMDVDSSRGGPEIIQFDNPAPLVYSVGVHFFDDAGWGEVLPTLQVYIDGSLASEITGSALRSLGAGGGQWWLPGEIDMATSTVVTVDTIHDDTPLCGG